jgi:hypothetical protein
MASEKITHTPRRWLLLWILGTQLLVIVLMFLSINLFSSFYRFTGGENLAGSDKMFGWIAVGVCLLFYPVFPVICGIGAWIAYVKQWNKAAILLAGLPLIPALLVAGPSISWYIYYPIHP